MPAKRTILSISNAEFELGTRCLIDSFRAPTAGTLDRSFLICVVRRALTARLEGSLSTICCNSSGLRSTHGDLLDLLSRSRTRVR